MDRREFLGAAAALPLSSFVASTARVRGIVKEAGSAGGIADVVVSDGRRTTLTRADGTFELISDRARRFAFVSLPRAYEVPERFYVPLRFDASGEASATFTLSRSEDDGANHRFLAFGDTQIADRDDARALHEATKLIADATRNLALAFGVTCGDLVDDALDLFPEYEVAVKRTGTPFFHVVGNHDLDPEVDSFRDTTSFERHFGPPHYSFNRGAVHYVALNDVFWVGGGYIGFLDEEQLEWLASDLSRVERGAPVVVFAHIPFLSTMSERIGGRIAPREAEVTNRERLLRLLEPFDVHLLTAHTHDNEHLRHGGVHEHVLGTVCGAWWSGPICWDGTPNGFHVFEFQDARLSWRFQATGQSPERQMRVYRPGTDPSRPGELLVNVFNWSPGFRVTLYQDGRSLGPMERVRGLDPLAVSLYGGPLKPLRNPDWVDPVLTDHLFRAEPEAGAQTLRVEATDPFGRVFTETLSL